MRPDRLRNWLLRVFQILGELCLFGAIAIDFGSVVGRRLGFSFLGAIEIIQLCIVGAVGSALMTATLTGAHAAVHLLVTRVSPAWRRRLERLSELTTILAFLLLCAGGGWVAMDLWPQDERSDLLHLPYAPARLFWCVILVLAAAVALAALFQRRDDLEVLAEAAQESVADV